MSNQEMIHVILIDAWHMITRLYHDHFYDICFKIKKKITCNMAKKAFKEVKRCSVYCSFFFFFLTIHLILGQGVLSCVCAWAACESVQEWGKQFLVIHLL